MTGTRAHPSVPSEAAGSRPPGLDDGRAIIEFIFLGVLLLLPLTYLVLTAASIQAASFSVSLASREAGRAFVTADSDEDALGRARAAAALAFADFDFSAEGRLTVTCDGSPCLRPDGQVRSTASITVRLPLVPDLVAEHLPSSVTVESENVATVDRFVSR